VALAVARSLGAPRRLRSAQESEDFEQELVDQFLLAGLGAGVTDGVVASERLVVFEFSRFLGRPLWTAGPEDADRFLVAQRRDNGLARSTVQRKAWTLAGFFDFLTVRYQGDIHALTGYVVEQVIDEFNRPAKAEYGSPRVPPSDDEVDTLFAAWRDSLPLARNFPPPGTTSPRRCGVGSGCASARPLGWTSGTGAQIWVRSASCMCGSARAAGAAARRRGWSRRLTASTC